mgnify:CR=1 FL=1
MSSISTLHTLVPNANVPLGYFDEQNIQFVQKKIKEVLSIQFKQDILFDRASIIRLMSRALLERIEAIPKMNERAVMMGTNEFRVHQLQINKRLKWEAHYVLSQRLYDPSVQIQKFDSQPTIPTNKYGVPHVGGTVRFYFT